ncbi:MAG: phosphoheptose isomerase [Bdellovibrionaceae bacterium]|nr:phosphoheptose isomerase [Pseudobdellovibrionaceae bacterium]|tara:strand:+ start:1849 stop:2427 length:579 start_codon:yes stop_codon:yes gene_type:complete
MSTKIEQWHEELRDSLVKTQYKINDNSICQREAYNQFSSLLKQTKERQGSIYWVANGGSNAIAAHLSQDIINKLKIASHSFTNSSLITCMSNDYGYENVYKIPLETYLKSEDLLIAISSSGNSKNILSAIETAQKKNCSVIGVSGMKDSNLIWNQKDLNLNIYLPSKRYGITEVGHEALLHGMIEVFSESNN